MSAPESLASLRERATRSQHSAWLAAPVDDLCSSIDDDEVASIVRFVAEKLKLRTVESLLSSLDAERAFQKALTSPIRHRLYVALEGFVRGDNRHPTRVAAPKSETVVEDVPRVASAIAAWAKVHGVDDRLDRPASAVLAFAESGAHLAKHPFDAAATVHDVLHRRRLPTSISSASTLTEAARAYLHHEATRVAELRTHTARWASEPDSVALRRSSITLRTLHRTISERAPLEVPVVEILKTLEIDVPNKRLVARFSPPSRAASRSEVTAYVSFDPHTASVRCDCVRGAKNDDCAHAVRAVAEAVDVLHSSEHPLAEAARSMLDVDAGSTLAEGLSRALEAPEAPPERRVAFRLDLTDTISPVKAVVRRRHRDGGYSAGTMTTFEKAESEATIIDERTLAVLALGIATEKASDPSRLRRALVESLVGYESVLDPDEPKRVVRVVSRPIALSVELDLDSARIGFRVGHHGVEPAELARTDSFVRFDDEAREYVVADVDPRVRRLAAALEGGQVVTRLSAEAFVDTVLTRFPSMPLALPDELAGAAIEPDRRLVVRLSPVAPTGLRAALVSRPIADVPPTRPGEGPVVVIGLLDRKRVHVHRDLQDEIARAHRLAERLALDTGHEEGPYSARFDEPDDALGLLERLHDVSTEVIVEWPKGTSPYRIVRAKTGSPSVRVRTAARWLGVDGELATEGGAVQLSALLAAVRSGKRYVAVTSGTFMRIEDAMRARLAASADALFEAEGGLALAHAQASILESLADEASLDLDEPVRDLRSRVEAARSLSPIAPSGLDAILRSYQLEGFQWMGRLAAMGFGCLLADEMGLGKTLQSLALIASRASLGPALVVTPTSVAEGWGEEARKFTPELRPRVHLGARRGPAIDGLGAGDLLVTSYEVLARDIESISTVRFGTVIFDEAHMLKNARTRRSEAARSVDAAARIALTGTPIENHLGDLFGIFDVVSPGLLGTWPHFRDRYATPIEKHGDASRRTALRKLVEPYVLRRTKGEVALELPPRIEVEHSIDMSPAEALLYEAARRDAITELSKGESSVTRRRFAVLAAITRLRQLACHPKLVDETSDVPSSKLEAFIELARDLVREGHRTLVFSQFVRHLDLVRQALDAAGLESLRLDGSTPAKDRARLVATFQKGETPFFLVSLKAGGTGLNLTAADYVVHLDPWWNPAVEDQASDRAHRLGQTQPVTIVRLVTNDSIERAVIRLHGEKRSLADALLAESGKIGGADLDELVSLITAT